MLPASRALVITLRVITNAADFFEKLSKIDAGVPILLQFSSIIKK